MNLTLQLPHLQPVKMTMSAVLEQGTAYFDSATLALVFQAVVEFCLKLLYASINHLIKVLKRRLD
jgi:hypothetical protein